MRREAVESTVICKRNYFDRILSCLEWCFFGYTVQNYLSSVEMLHSAKATCISRADYFVHFP